MTIGVPLRYSLEDDCSILYVFESVRRCIQKAGGDKFTPYDRYILEYAIKKDIPTLGVCLSMQMMSCYKEEVELGNIESNVEHKVSSGELCHYITIDKNSKLYKILGKEKIMVNSLHKHKALENHIYKSIAWSEDGIIEALENPLCTFNIGVQWHPEKLYNTDINSKLIIDTFMEEAYKYHKRKIEDIIEII